MTSVIEPTQLITLDTGYVPSSFCPKLPTLPIEKVPDLIAHGVSIDTTSRIRLARQWIRDNVVASD